MTAPVLMVVGTASSVGKSVLVTALCRIFADLGVRVTPFKAQNMSNNAAVTADGLEIGRAQAEQAAAARIEPMVQMNPVLLKPQGDRTSQLVLDGRPAGLLRSVDFLERKRDLWPHVERALATLRDQYELVIVEGAGSPAEPNLQAGDIVNMRVARHTNAVTLLVGDIDRGGVFAHFLGTLDLMTTDDRALVRGLVINRFRGDPSLLQPAIDVIEERGGVPVLGIVPWIDRLGVADEDAQSLERAVRGSSFGAQEVDVAVIRLPRIANFDDIDPLLAEPGVGVRWVESAQEIGTPDLIVIPGTKATVADLAWLRGQRLDGAIQARAEAGASILGICGGYQLLGERLIDRAGVEAAPGTEVTGLGLLPVVTEFTAAKETRRVAGIIRPTEGMWAATSGLEVRGYEIHMGRTHGSAAALLTLDGHHDGAVSADGRVAGTYLHGLFHNDGLRRALLSALGRTSDGADIDTDAEREAAFNRLADVVRDAIDIGRLRAMLEEAQQ
jgi:adenosylcobyric acid synthase